MKKLILICATFFCALSIYAQATYVNGVLQTNGMPTLPPTIGVFAIPPPVTTLPEPSGITSTLNLSATNWVVIPFAIYDTSTKAFGEGAAILYQVNPVLWTGLRIQSVDHQKTEAGVQAQIQATYTVGSFVVHPFLETSVGMGSSSLYGSVGPGAWVTLFSHNFSNKYILNMGLIGDYEHYVYSTKNGNDIDAGLMINLCW